MKHLKIYEDYQDSIEDFVNLKEGDILIAKYDIYIRLPKGVEVNYNSPKLSLFGDKLFVKKGKNKKITKNTMGGIYLTGFNHLVPDEKLQRYFTIKNGELLKNMRKFNL